MGSICIIPARGGSKRIPRKNIKEFYGKPIIAYSIETAIKSELFDEIMVSTDDKEIAEISLKYGAKVPFLRSNDSANDYATLADVLIEVLERYRNNEINFENTCCILPTAPFINVNVLVDAHNKLNSNFYDSIIPVVEFSYPIQRSLKIKKDYLVMNWPENLNKRSQDLEPIYHDSGQFYFFKTNSFLNGKNFFTKHTGYILLNNIEVQDIDTEIDWKLAELKYKLMQEPE